VAGVWWIVDDGDVWAWVESAAVGVVANMCEREVILCFTNIQFFFAIF
jgi:hypothetical protein